MQLRLRTKLTLMMTSLVLLVAAVLFWRICGRSSSTNSCRNHETRERHRGPVVFRKRSLQ